MDTLTAIGVGAALGAAGDALEVNKRPARFAAWLAAVALAHAYYGVAASGTAAAVYVVGEYHPFGVRR